MLFSSDVNDNPALTTAPSAAEESVATTAREVIAESITSFISHTLVLHESAGAALAGCLMRWRGVALALSCRADLASLDRFDNDDDAIYDLELTYDRARLIEAINIVKLNWATASRNGHVHCAALWSHLYSMLKVLIATV